MSDASGAGAGQRGGWVSPAVTLAARKARLLLKLVEAADAAPEQPRPGGLLGLIKEISVILSKIPETSAPPECHETLRETEPSARAPAHFLEDSSARDGQRVRMAAAFLDCQLNLLAQMSGRSND